MTLDTITTLVNLCTARLRELEIKANHEDPCLPHKDFDKELLRFERYRLERAITDLIDLADDIQQQKNIQALVDKGQIPPESPDDDDPF